MSNSQRVGRRLAVIDTGAADYSDQVVAVLTGELRRSRRERQARSAANIVRGIAAGVALPLLLLLSGPGVQTVVFGG